jgi:glycosyltransferase involved in cell wall biosynthesis
MIAYTHYRTDPRCRREATLAASHGWAVHFYALARGGRARQTDQDGIVLHELPMDRYRGASSAAYMMSYLRFLWLSLAAVTRDHRRRRFQVVHINTMPDFMVWAGQVARAMGAKVILDVHDVMPELYMSKFGLPASHWKIRLIRAIEVGSARMADAVLTAEHPKRDLLVQHGIASEKVTVLLNLPDEKLFHGAHTRTPPEDGRFRLVYHGTLAHRLGVDLVVRAVKMLESRYPHLRLDVYGEGDQLPELRRMVATAGLGGRIEISGRFEPIEEIIPRIEKAHLGVLATRLDPGTDFMLPTKLIEYLVLGVPALVVPTRTVRYYFGEDSPLYIAEDTPEAVADRIAWAIENYAAVDSTAAEARERFLGRYRWATHQRVYLDLLERLVSHQA